MAERTVRAITRVTEGTPTSDGAGVKLTRILGTPELDHLDPFLLLDEFRSDDPDEYIAGFPAHPHRGFETVTYLLRGKMRHEDSVGNSGLLSDGAVQWMTAGRGIIHSEMPEQTDGMLWGFQLWVNLPAARKMTAPRYQDIAAERIPEVSDAGGTVRLIAGSLGDRHGPVESLTGIVYLDVRRRPNAAFAYPLADDVNALVYVYDGALEGVDTVGRARPVQSGQLAILSPRGALEVEAGTEGARFLLIAGRPLGEPIARMGPFVMNSRQELMQAVEDYRSGTLAR